MHTYHWRLSGHLWRFSWPLQHRLTSHLNAHGSTTSSPLLMDACFRVYAPQKMWRYPGPSFSFFSFFFFKKRWMPLLMYFRGVRLCLKFHSLNKFLTHGLTQSCWPALDLGSPLPGYVVCILWERSARKEGREVAVLLGSHTILIRCLFACLWSLFIS